MPIDTSIYGNLQTPDFAGNIERGLRMRDLMDQRKKQTAIRDAYQKGTSLGPDGKLVVDRGLTMKSLYEVSPEDAIKAEDRFAQQDAAKAKGTREQLEQTLGNMKRAHEIFAAAKDQESWDQASNIVSSLGLMKREQISPVYDEKQQSFLANLFRTGTERLQQEQAERGWTFKERELATKGAADPLAQEMKYERLDKMKRERADADFKRTPEGKLQSLSGEQKQRLDNAKLGLTSVQGMAQALLGQGQNTFSVFGDNDFTQQRTLFEEALGRMQSGGAITAEEADRFKEMAPTFRDSADIQRKKLVQLQNEMASRLGTLGFKPTELGVSLSDIPNIKMKNSGTAGLEKANAAGGRQVFKTSDIEWAD